MERREGIAWSDFFCAKTQKSSKMKVFENILAKEDNFDGYFSIKSEILQNTKLPTPYNMS